MTNWTQKSVHYWKDGRVVQDLPDDAHANLHCVDTRFPDPAQRYGMYVDGGWKPILLTDMPKEFRTHLLLLGVS